MTHLEEELSAYVSNELDERERVVVEEHLAGCRECAEQLNRLQKLNTLLAVQDEPQPSPLFVQEVMRRVDQESKVTVLWTRRNVIVLAAAAMLAFFVFLLSVQTPVPTPPPVTKKPSIQPIPHKPNVIPPAVPDPKLPTEDPELIAHLEELENMDLIENLDNLDNLDVAILMEDSREME